MRMLESVTTFIFTILMVVVVGLIIAIPLAPYNPNPSTCGNYIVIDKSATALIFDAGEYGVQQVETGLTARYRTQIGGTVYACKAVQFFTRLEKWILPMDINS